MPTWGCGDAPDAESSNSRAAVDDASRAGRCGGCSETARGSRRRQRTRRNGDTQTAHRRRQSYVEFYGQINKGLLVFDDGEETLGYFPVDNGNSSYPLRRSCSTATSMTDWSLGGNLEWEWNPYSTNNVNQLNRGDFDWDTDLLRKAEAYVNSEDLGKLWLGQGSMASDGTAEVDLSGTTVVGYSLVADMAGGPFFRLDDGDALRSARQGCIHEFRRSWPQVARSLRHAEFLGGFSLATSVGTQMVPDETNVTVWDIAARYDNTIDDFKVAGAVAFSEPGEDHRSYDGSVSFLHEPTGLSLTVARPIRTRKRPTDATATSSWAIRPISSTSAKPRFPSTPIMARTSRPPGATAHPSAPSCPESGLPADRTLSGCAHPTHTTRRPRISTTVLPCWQVPE